MNPQFEERDPNAPIGYGADGKPLYASPQSGPRAAASGERIAPDVINEDPQYHPQSQQVPTVPDTMPRVVHLTRNPSPEKPVLSEEVQRRHTESIAAYPDVNLSEAEYVLSDVRRHPIGMVGPLAGGGFVIIALAVVLALYPTDPSKYSLPDFGIALAVIGTLMVLIGVGALVSVWVYLQNHFYLTNESVIQNIQNSLFSKTEQTINLGNIEDASYTQQGPIQMMFDYGSIRLSTEGDETTYRMTYVSHPKRQVDTLTNAVEAFKNGRPVEGS